jgi:uncharacterized membrane protein (Fun14 family)
MIVIDIHHRQNSLDSAWKSIVLLLVGMYIIVVTLTNQGVRIIIQFLKSSVLLSKRVCFKC